MESSKNSLRSKRLQARSQVSKEGANNIRRKTLQRNLNKKTDFSLYFFASGISAEQTEEDVYGLEVEAAQHADKHGGYSAVWTPERHFEAFGSCYPNPSTLSAALAMVTKRLEIRAGSVVLPLHHPVRVVEEWSLVDNLSKGRVGLSVATGWHKGDFIFNPEAFDNRREICYQNIHTIQKLWRGETVNFPTTGGAEHAVNCYPRPIQKQLPIWLTSSGSEKTFKDAGDMNLNILCALLPFEDLKRNISTFRESAAKHADGHKRKVTVMVHTYVDETTEKAREVVRGPLVEYLKAHIVQKHNSFSIQNGDEQKSVRMQESDLDDMAEQSFNDFFNGRSLIGDKKKVMATINKLIACDVDEIAFLINFGLSKATILNSFQYLDPIVSAYKKRNVDELFN